MSVHALPGQLALANTGVADVPLRGEPVLFGVFTPYVLSWPEEYTGIAAPAVEQMTLADALTRAHANDAHIVAYTAPLPFRLNKSYILDPKARETAISSRQLTDDARAMALAADYSLTMRLFIVDIDGPLHAHKAAIRKCKASIERATGSNDAQAIEKLKVELADLEARTPWVEHEKWWHREREKIEQLHANHSAFVYRTNGGYRIIGWLDNPHVIRTAADRDAWSRQYLIWLGHLSLTYSIVGDAGCAYCECLYRLPRVVRDGVTTIPETIGDPMEDLQWCLDAEVEDDAALAEARRLWATRVDKPLRSSGGGGEVHDVEELRARWEAFTEEEKTRRRNLYREELKTIPATTKESVGRALVAARSGVIGFGIGDLNLAVNMMMEIFAPRCDWPWTKADLVHKVEDAAANSMGMELDFNLPEVRDRLAKERNDRLIGQFKKGSTSTNITPLVTVQPSGKALPAAEVQRKIREALDKIC